VNELGVALMVAGLLLAPLTSEPWHLYLTLGVLVGGGSVCLGYSGQSLFLPHWFVRRRGLAVGLAFAGVGVGSIALLPWVQVVIEQVGWRAACTAMGVLLLVVLAPINLLVRKRPEDMGLQPDGDAAPDGRTPAEATNVVNAEWAAVDWTLARAVRTAPFWWIALAYVSALYVWYAVQVHQTKYLVEIGFSPATAAWALGLVSLIGIPGQVVLGHISDRVGREWIWTASSLGFIICYAALILLQHYPTSLLLYVMVAAQGGLGYGLTSIFGAMVAEIFQGKHYGVIFGTLMLAAIIGGAVGPWATGVLYDANGSYAPAFWICIGLSVVSAAAIWQAAPRKVRAVAGRAHRLRQQQLGSRPQQ
jgi:sugar phosphate permease